MLLSNQEQLPHQLHPMASEQAEPVQGTCSTSVINEWSISPLTSNHPSARALFSPSLCGGENNLRGFTIFGNEQIINISDAK